MRPFAKLTRHGQSCYVDPDLVGLVFAETPIPGRAYPPGFAFGTTLMPRGGDLGPLIAGIEEPPDEVYRRLAAAGQTVTKAEYEDIRKTLTEEALYGGKGEIVSRIRDARTVDEAAASLLGPLLWAYRKLRSTTLAALWVAEGEEPPND